MLMASLRVEPAETPGVVSVISVISYCIALPRSKLLSATVPLLAHAIKGVINMSIDSVIFFITLSEVVDIYLH